MFEITIEKVFSASHALRLPGGGLEPLHGHDWDVRVTVGSAGLDALQTVMDFHVLEREVDAVLAPWRNRHLNEVEPFADEAWNPSAERVAQWIGSRVAAGLPEGVSLVSVAVGEAPGCTAVYRP